MELLYQVFAIRQNPGALNRRRKEGDWRLKEGNGSSFE